MSGRRSSRRRSSVESEYERPKVKQGYERPKVGAGVRLKDAITNMVTLYDFTHLHVFSGAVDFNVDRKVHWSRGTKSELILRQVLHVLTSLPEDCTTCTIACSGDVGIYKFIFTSIEEFIVAFETPGYYGGKWGHTERYSQLEW